MDAEENRAAFIWDYGCNENALSEGCERRQYVAGGKFKKRHRVRG